MDVDCGDVVLGWSKCIFFPVGQFAISWNERAVLPFGTEKCVLNGVNLSPVTYKNKVTLLSMVREFRQYTLTIVRSSLHVHIPVPALLSITMNGWRLQGTRYTTISYSVEIRSLLFSKHHVILAYEVESHGMGLRS